MKASNLYDNVVPKRAMMQRATVRVLAVKGFTQNPNTEKVPTRSPPKGNDTSMHHRCWRRNVELSLGKTFTDTRLVRPRIAFEVGLQNTV
jgi:hypothetical protein